MVIVELSGDQDKLRDRCLAVCDFVSSNPTRPIVVVKSDSIPLPLHLPCEVLSSGHTYRQAAELLASHEDGVLLSAGDTRKVLVSNLSRAGVGLIDPDIAPVLAAVIPKSGGKDCILCDGGGATLFPTVEHALWCAAAGQIVASELFGYDPLLGLLNIGAEAGKGGPLMEEVRLALGEEYMEGFYGNIEPHLLRSSEVDVAVITGFIGNFLIKCVELGFGIVKDEMTDACRRNPALIPLAKAAKYFFFRRVDWRNYCGAYLIGTRRPIVITHGRSDRKAFLVALNRSAHPAVPRIWKRVEQCDYLNRIRQTREAAELLAAAIASAPYWQI